MKMPPLLSKTFSVLSAHLLWQVLSNVSLSSSSVDFSREFNVVR